jgi:hypothetical protein
VHILARTTGWFQAFLPPRTRHARRSLLASGQPPPTGIIPVGFVILDGAEEGEEEDSQLHEHDHHQQQQLQLQLEQPAAGLLGGPAGTGTSGPPSLPTTGAPTEPGAATGARASAASVGASGSGAASSRDRRPSAGGSAAGPGGGGVARARVPSTASPGDAAHAHGAVDGPGAGGVGRVDTSTPSPGPGGPIAAARGSIHSSSPSVAALRGAGTPSVSGSLYMSPTSLVGTSGGPGAALGSESTGPNAALFVKIDRCLKEWSGSLKRYLAAGNSRLCVITFFRRVCVCVCVCVWGGGEGGCVCVNCLYGGGGVRLRESCVALGVSHQ